MPIDQETLEKLKNAIRDSDLLSEDEKQDWLFLLPKMTPQQQNYLRQILALPFHPDRRQETETRIPDTGDRGPTSEFRPPTSDLRTPPPPKPIQPTTPKPTPPPASASLPKPIPASTPIPKPTPASTPPPTPSLDDIKQLSVDKLKSAPSVYAFLAGLKESFSALLKQGQVGKTGLLKAFEESPLYQTYLTVGLALMSGEQAAELSRDQFEAISEFRDSLKSL